MANQLLEVLVSLLSRTLSELTFFWLSRSDLSYSFSIYYFLCPHFPLFSSYRCSSTASTTTARIFVRRSPCSYSRFWSCSSSCSLWSVWSASSCSCSCARIFWFWNSSGSPCCTRWFWRRRIRTSCTCSSWRV